MNRAIFLDRDGTINEDKGHVYKIEDFKLLKNAVDGLKLLNGFKLIIVKTESGVAKGHFRISDYEKFHNHLISELNKKNIKIDATYTCFHHPNAIVNEYKIDCDCRKPKPGLVLQAAKDWNIDLKNSWMVGDKRSDIESGRCVGCKTILVKTGYGGKGGDTELDTMPDFIADDLLDAAKIIINLDK